MQYFSVNGEKQETIAITDRSIAYGDGIFTTAKIEQGKIEFLAAHMKRLIEGCHHFNIPFEQHDILLKEIITIARNYSLAVLKIIITAGSGGRGYSKDGANSPLSIVSIHEFPSHYQEWKEKGINISNGSIRLGLNPLFNGLKHLNRLEQVMIRKELDSSSADDFVVTDLNGHIVESSCANIFWFKEGLLCTPKIDNAGIKGVYRQALLSFEPSIQQVKHHLDELTHVTSMFICNSIMGIVPIKKYNNKTLDIQPVIQLKERYIKSQQGNIT